MLKTAASGLGFQNLTRDLANINACKAMFDPYITNHFFYYLYVVECKKYLGCDVSDYGTNGKLCLHIERFLFNSFSIEGSYDQTDTESDITSESSFLRSSGFRRSVGSCNRPDSEDMSLGSSKTSDSSFNSGSSS